MRGQFGPEKWGLFGRNFHSDSKISYNGRLTNRRIASMVKTASNILKTLLICITEILQPNHNFPSNNF